MTHLGITCVSNSHMDIYLVWQGSRIYAGWGKNITPNKRLMLRVLDNTTISKEEADQSIADLHTDPTHQFEESTGKKVVDVLSNPIPDCMCQVKSTKE